MWVAAKQPIEDVEKFIKIDILRSVTGRLRMYIDAHHQSGQFTLVSEPPRRVFFKLKSSPVMFSDYLFRGESEDTIIAQAQTHMDINLDKQMIVGDIETMSGNCQSKNARKMSLIDSYGWKLLSDEICYEEDAPGENAVKKPSTTPKRSNNRAIYAMGIMCAVGILLISVGVHVLLNSDNEEN